MLRRCVFDVIGGWDIDVRILQRLRNNKLSKTAIVPTAHYFHHTSDSFGKYCVKLSRRVVRYAKFSKLELGEYLVRQPSNSKEDVKLRSDLVRSLVTDLVRPFEVMWARKYRQSVYYFLNVFANYSAILLHPIYALRLYKNYL